MLAEEIAEQILHRAQTVQCSEQWVGLFEWIARGVMRSTRVQILFGSYVVDVLAWFAPTFVVETPAFITRAAAVRLRGDAWRTVQTDAGCLPLVNHYVLGAPIKGTAVQVWSGLDKDKKPVAERCAIAAGMEAGWLLQPTVAQGDCGIDVMAASASMTRSPDNWQLVRNVNYWYRLRQASLDYHPF